MGKKTGTPDEGRGGMSRRGFLTTVGAGTAGIAVLGGLSSPAPAGAETMEAEQTSKLKLQVNGLDYELLVEPRWTLLFVLREKLGLAGTKAGCERGECGACTVLIDGAPKYSCLMLAVEAEGREIATVEGLMNGEELGPTQQAFLEHDAYQCGYCTPGQIMAVEGLLRSVPEPGLDEIRHGVSGNLCRCGAYKHIFDAAAKAAVLKKKG